IQIIHMPMIFWILTIGINHQLDMNVFQLSMLLLFSLMTSCTASYLITVGRDGSAKISVDRDKPADIARYYQSEIISDIDTNVTGWRVEYVISTIDSLGLHLPYHP